MTTRKMWFTSDWHLADGAWVKRPEIAGDAFRSLKALVEKVAPGDIILAAGDLFDTKHPSAAGVLEARSLLSSERLAVVGQPALMYIQGQHEAQPEVPWMALVTGYHCDSRRKPHLPYVRFDSDNYAIDVYGLDWTLHGQLREQLETLGSLLRASQRVFQKTDGAKKRQHVNLLMLHQTCNAVMASVGEDRQKILDSLAYRSCELQDSMLPPGFDMVIVGDTHHHGEFYLLDTEGTAVPCYSPGSFAMQSIAETNVGQCFAMNMSTLEVESVPLYQRQYVEKHIKNPIEFDQAVRDAIKLPTLAQEDMPIVRYYLYGRDAERMQALRQACIDKEHPFFHIPTENAEEYIDGAAETENIDEIVIQAIRESTASESAKDMLVDLVMSDSSDEVINAYYKDMVLSHVETSET